MQTRCAHLSVVLLLLAVLSPKATLGVALATAGEWGRREPPQRGFEPLHKIEKLSRLRAWARLLCYTYGHYG